VMDPRNPDVLYAAAYQRRRHVWTLIDGGPESALYKSRDAGATWQKLTDRVYLLDTFNKVSDDGGKTFRLLGEASKHVDNHALWIDPANTDHLRATCDGGGYETGDRPATWKWKPTLPLAQLYRGDVDYALPFYNIVGGAQDNGSVAGPSRTQTVTGVTNRGRGASQGGDGFVSKADPEDPNTVYAQSQYGGVGRHDRRNGVVG